MTLSHTGYVKSQPLAEYRAQRRGGRGKQATLNKEDDWVEQLFIANTHDYILCFSSLGRVYWIKVYEVPQGTRVSRGKPIVNLVQLQDGEKINAILPVKAFDDNQFVFMVAGHAESERLFEFAAGGFRDFTRIASSSPEMWRDICLANRDAIGAVLADYQGELARIADILGQGDGAMLEQVFARARDARDAWVRKSGGR